MLRNQLSCRFAFYINFSFFKPDTENNAILFCCCLLTFRWLSMTSPAPPILLTTNIARVTNVYMLCYGSTHRRYHHKNYILYIFIHQKSWQQWTTIINSNNREKNIFLKCGISTVIYKAAAAGGIFHIKPFNTIWPQLTWQLRTKVRLTVSYNLDVTRSEHLRKNLLTTKSKELSSDLTRGCHGYGSRHKRYYHSNYEVVIKTVVPTWTRANFHSVSEFPVTLWNEADMMAISRLMRIIGPQKK